MVIYYQLQVLTTWLSLNHIRRSILEIKAFKEKTLVWDITSLIGGILFLKFGINVGYVIIMMGCGPLIYYFIKGNYSKDKKE